MLTGFTLSNGHTRSTGSTYYDASGGDIRNSIIYFNNGLIGNNWTNYSTGMSFDYICTTPTNMLPGGTGCIDDNPLFADASNEDYRLLSYSPCVNTGNNAYTNSLIDLSGGPRIINNIVDMGSYEFSYPPQIATNALFFLAKDSIIFASTPTNVIWNAEKITDDVDSSSLTNSRIFWDNKFSVVPEIGTVFSILWLRRSH